jgi:predicted amidohydrolase
MQAVALQYDIQWEDKAASQAEMDRLLAQSPPQPGSLVVTPELGDVGFSRALDVIIDPTSQAWAVATARRYSCYLLHGWAEWAPDGTRGLNTMGLVNPEGVLLGQYEKVFPFRYSREHEAFDSGQCLHLFDNVGGMTVCPLLCYDLRFPELFRLARLAGAEVFAIGANWPEARIHHFRSLAIARAIENQAWVVAVNRTGTDPHLCYCGRSLIIDPRGDVVADAGASPGVIQAELDPMLARSWRESFPCHDDIRPELLGRIDIVRHAC